MSSPLISIAAIALFTLSPSAAAQDVVLIHVRVDRDDGKPIRFPERGAQFSLEARVQGELGWQVRGRVQLNDEHKHGVAW
ncbi:MAG: hypothetical protein ACI8QC_000860 [Planctomycetota bacterium]|jgi:hypothetical protein